MGHQGGRAAAVGLAGPISELTHSDRSQVHVWVFYSKDARLENLRKLENEASPTNFEQFVVGFNQASARILMADLGGGKGEIETKIKGMFMLQKCRKCPF